MTRRVYLRSADLRIVMDPFQRPIQGRLLSLTLVLALAVFVSEAAAFSEMIPDHMLIVRYIIAFSFWCAVIGLSFPPTLGIEVLLKGLALGILSCSIATLCQWTYQFAADGSRFEDPRLPALIAAISTPIFVVWSTISAAMDLRRPRENQKLLVLLAKDPVFTSLGSCVAWWA